MVQKKRPNISDIETFCCIRFLHTKTLIKKSLLTLMVWYSFFYVRAWWNVLQLVCRITALSLSAVLKSIFNSILTRLLFCSYLTSNILTLNEQTDRSHWYIFHKPLALFQLFHKSTTDTKRDLQAIQNAASNECSILNLMRPDCYCRQIFTMKLKEKKMKIDAHKKKLNSGKQNVILYRRRFRWIEI